MSLEKEFKQNWERRYEMTPEVRGTLSEWWEKESKLYYLAAPVVSVKDHLAETLDKIEVLDSVEPYERHFLHMTVKVFEEKPRKEKIDAVVSDYDPFEVHLDTLNVFPQVLFIESPTIEIRELNKNLSEIFEPRENDGASYLPHVSLGQYREDVKWAKTIREIESMRSEISSISFRVEELVLLKDKRTNKPEFEKVEKFELM